MRLEVSWMVSRMAFMPSIVRRTASPPLCAMPTEWRATSEARSALPETSSMEPAIELMDSVAAAICRDCALEDLARCCASACVCRAVPSSCSEDALMVVTSPRSDSTAMFTESAMAPVMSSVTVAVAVRSPWPRPAISSSSRRMAAWLRSPSRFCVSMAWRATWVSSCVERTDRNSIASGTSTASAVTPAITPYRPPL